MEDQNDGGDKGVPEPRTESRNGVGLDREHVAGEGQHLRRIDLDAAGRWQGGQRRRHSCPHPACGTLHRPAGPFAHRMARCAQWDTPGAARPPAERDHSHMLRPGVLIDEV